MPKFSKKPVVIEAERFTDVENPPAGVSVMRARGGYTAWVTTIHGQETLVVLGDWIVPEPMPGRFYPVKPDVFAATYESAE